MLAVFVLGLTVLDMVVLGFASLQLLSDPYMEDLSSHFG